MKFEIPGRGTTITISGENVRPYIGPNDPPLDWYKTFCSAQYAVVKRRRLRDGYHLTPVVNRPVYTFEFMQDFVINARQLHLRLLTIEGQKPSVEHQVPQYRVIRSPVRAHSIYRLPPIWRIDMSEL